MAERMKKIYLIVFIAILLAGCVKESNHVEINDKIIEIETAETPEPPAQEPVVEPESPLQEEVLPIEDAPTLEATPIVEAPMDEETAAQTEQTPETESTEEQEPKTDS